MTTTKKAPHKLVGSDAFTDIKSGKVFIDADATEVNDLAEKVQQRIRPGVLARLVGGMMLATYRDFSDSAKTGSWRNPPSCIVEFANSTEQRVIDLELYQGVIDLFGKGDREFFENGNESEFSRNLEKLVYKWGREAIGAIGDYVLLDKAKPQVASEAIRRVADIDDSQTFNKRWSLLQRSLDSKSSAIRDGAILGFAALDDPRAVKLLKNRATTEKVKALQGLIEKVVHQLEAHQ